MTQQTIKPPAGAVNQLFLNDTVGIQVAVLEAADDGVTLFPAVGPLKFTVTDPSNTVTQGVAADGVTPTFLPNGTGNTGSVEVDVLDQGNNLVGDASFDVLAPVTPPPPTATQLGVFFVPNTAPAAAAPAAAGTDAATAAAVKAAQTAAGQVVTDPHNPAKK